MDKLLSIKEVSELLSISDQVIRKWMNSGKIKYLKLGKGRTASIKFRQSDIDEYLNNCIVCNNQKAIKEN